MNFFHFILCFYGLRFPSCSDCSTVEMVLFTTGHKLGQKSSYFGRAALLNVILMICELCFRFSIPFSFAIFIFRYGNCRSHLSFELEPHTKNTTSKSHSLRIILLVLQIFTHLILAFRFDVLKYIAYIDECTYTHFGNANPKFEWVHANESMLCVPGERTHGANNG